MNDLHDRLVEAYLEYFKANEAWERKQSVRKYYAVQKCVREIRDLADLRNKEIRQQHQTKKDKEQT